VFVYFQIEKFYQNHRSYTSSRNDQERGGMDVSFRKRAKTCGNNLFVNDGRDKDLQRASRAGDCDSGRFAPSSDECRHYSPCGLMARSFFTDRFSLLEPYDAVMDEENIANYWDRIRFRNRPGWDKLNSSETIGLVDQYGPMLARGVEDPHFQVWSRSAATSDFRKLYGIITKPSTLKKGTKLSFAVESTFDVDAYDGHKSLVIATTSVFGGYNPALAPLFLVTGLMYLAMGILLLLAVTKQNRDNRKSLNLVHVAQ